MAKIYYSHTVRIHSWISKEKDTLGESGEIHVHTYYVLTKASIQNVFSVHMK